MCYHTKQTKTAQELEQRFEASFAEGEAEAYAPTPHANGFAHPRTPVIAHREPHRIQLMEWGLLPHWAKDRSLQASTLNARAETLREKPAFRDSVRWPCLVLADGFYEWQWLDAKGKQKRQYLLEVAGQAAFAFAGLWSEWVDRGTGVVVRTYTIVTTEANELMAQIHNSKKRMPLILARQHEANWLAGRPIVPNEVDLVATAI
jgi:putative SOS response-associated peptidase YedK